MTESYRIVVEPKRLTKGRKKVFHHIVIWKSGKTTREFLYAEDWAEAILLASEKYDKREPVNIGTGQEISIRDLCSLICEIPAFKRKIIWDHTKPDCFPDFHLN